MKYLLDTNVVSELRKVKSGRADAGVISWSRSVIDSDLYLSVLVVEELEMGTQLLERRNPEQGRILREWLEIYTLPAFADRIVNVDARVARQCATLMVPNPRPLADALIAATALVHNMTVVTRNTDDFKGMGVNLFNPWLREIRS